MNKENKGMRLVAMIGKKNSEEYEVINFLPDIKIKHTEANNFEVIENPDYIKIPYAERIDDLTIIVGENGVGKTSIINNIFKLNGSFIFIYEVKDFDKMGKKYFCKNNIGSKLQLSNNGKKVNLFSFTDSRDIIPIRFSTAIESSTEYQKIDFDLSTTHKLSSQNVLETNQEDMSNQIEFLKDYYEIDDFLFDIEDKVIVIQLELSRNNRNGFLNYIDFIKKEFGGEDDQREAIMELYDTDENFSEYIEEYYRDYGNYGDFGDFGDYGDFLLGKYRNIIQSDPNYITYLEEKYNIGSEDYINVDEEIETLDSIDLGSFILDKNNVFDSINRMIKGYLCHILCCKNLNDDVSEPLEKFYKIAESKNKRKIFSFLPKVLEEIIESFTIENWVYLVVDMVKAEIDFLNDSKILKRKSKEIIETIKRISEIESYSQNISSWEPYVEYIEDTKIIEDIFDTLEFGNENYFSDLEQMWTDLSCEVRGDYIKSIVKEFSYKVRMEDIKIELENEESLGAVKKELLDAVQGNLDIKSKTEDIFDNGLVSTKLLFLKNYYKRLNNIVRCYEETGTNPEPILDMIKKFLKGCIKFWSKTFLI